MRYKSLFLIFILLFLSGCSATYNIEINNNSILEKLNINNVDINRFKNLKLPIDYEIDDFEAFDKKMEGIEYYNIDTEGNSVDISYYFNNDNFNTSMLFKNCYDSAVYSKDSYELLISTSDKFLCYDEYDELENVTVRINSNYKLINTNADKVSGHNYYWYINKSNKGNKKIMLRLDTTKINKSIFEKFLSSYLLVPIILIGIVLIVFLILYLLKKLGDRRNKI